MTLGALPDIFSRLKLAVDAFAGIGALSRTPPRDPNTSSFTRAVPLDVKRQPRRWVPVPKGWASWVADQAGTVLLVTGIAVGDTNTLQEAPFQICTRLACAIAR